MAITVFAIHQLQLILAPVIHVNYHSFLRAAQKSRTVKEVDGAYFEGPLIS